MQLVIALLLFLSGILGALLFVYGFKLGLRYQHSTVPMETEEPSGWVKRVEEPVIKRKVIVPGKQQPNPFDEIL